MNTTFQKDLEKIKAGEVYKISYSEYSKEQVIYYLDEEPFHEGTQFITQNPVLNDDEIFIVEILSKEDEIHKTFAFRVMCLNKETPHLGWVHLYSSDNSFKHWNLKTNAS